MRKFNLVNKIYLLLFFGMIIAIAVKVFMLRQRDKGRIYFSVTLTAPDTHPVYLQQAYMVAADGERNDIDDQRVNSEQYRWANVTDFEIRNKYRLPKAIVLSYASYRDKKYYNDSIPLPLALIDSIFKSSVAKGIQKTVRSNSGDVNALVFLIGIANNGHIVIWLQGKNYEQKLVSYQFKAQKPQGEMWYDGKDYSGEHFFEVFNVIPKFNMIQAVLANGKDSLANYADSTTHYLDHPQ
jgi:hypothetical protein